MSIDDVFGEAGLLAREMPGYSPRPQQIMLAMAVEEAILYGDNLIAEGPTGTGKSLAYLVPAIQHALDSGDPIIVSTAGIALQEQLVNKDLPLLARILPEPFNHALMKGRGNFVCLDRLSKVLYQARAQDQLFERGRAAADGLGPEMRRLVEWAEQTETGDRSELSFVPSNKAWGRLSVGSDECKGRRCRHHDGCFSVAARRRASDAQVVVVNHHLLFADLKYYGAILPPHDIVIIDEAHEAATIARDFLGGQVGQGSLRRMARKLRELEMNDESEMIEAAADDYFRRLARFARSDDYDTRLIEPESVNANDLMLALIKVAAQLGAAAARTGDEDRSAEFEVERRRAKNIWNLLNEADQLEDENLVANIELDKRDDRDDARLRVRPLDVAEILAETLFKPARSVVLASATLSVRGGFDHIINELGIPDAEDLIVESPFDPDNRIAIIPRDVPDPKKAKKEWESYVPNAVQRVIEMVGGRTLALFTSNWMLRQTAEHMAVWSDMPVLVQGEMPKSQLIDEFLRDERSSLLGTKSFWAGVDVPGQSLSCVIIDRIPFGSPADPIENAFSERLGRKAFAQRSLPAATIQMKQGVGRLIRRVTDRGVIVLLDPRLRSKGYGRGIMSSMGELEVFDDLEHIVDFLEISMDDYRHDPNDHYDPDEVPF